MLDARLAEILERTRYSLVLSVSEPGRDLPGLLARSLDSRVILEITMACPGDEIRARRAELAGMAKALKGLSLARIHLVGRVDLEALVSDGERALVGDLFRGGGVMVGSGREVSSLLARLRQYSGLGALFRPPELEALLKTRNAEARLRRFISAKIGRSKQGLFSRTLVYLLFREGPARTRALHKRIAEIHPELCRKQPLWVNGRRVGGDWKADVRSAQKFLKSKGVLLLRDGLWHLREGLDLD